MTNHSVSRRFAKDNKGSAVLTVIITMMFVVALGTALLYTAYRGLQVSVLARSDRENFYDASAAMDEIKAGVQNEVCSALKEAYTTTLVAYGKNDGSMEDIGGNITTDPQEAFSAAFLTELDKSDAFDVEYDPIAGISVSTDVDVIYLFATPKNGEELTLNGGVDVVVDEDGLTVQDLELTCISTDGYESIITTDLAIAIPGFFTGSAVSSGIGQYAIVANTGIEASTTGNKTITGGVYAGADGISVDTSDDLACKGGKVVTAGAISAADNSSLAIIPDSYDIWAKEINVGKNCSSAISGNIYVADDLVIGGGSEVALKGRYYGFGSEDASTAGRSDSKSSSIFVNSYVTGKNTTLNLNELDQLALAGVSFINVSKSTNANANENIATGESIAAKPDQLAYLVPAEAIKNYKTNPTILKKDESESVIAPIINTAAVLWSIDGENKTLADYIGDTDVTDNNYDGTYGSIVTYYTQGTDNVGYTFINFTNQTKANQYFKDYFTAKPDSIEQYLDIYLDLSKYEPKMAEITKGNIYRNAGTTEDINWENILGSAAFSDTQAEYYAEMYSKLSASPFETFIKKDNLDALEPNTVLNFGSDSHPVALVVTKNNFTLASDPKYSDVRIIIARSDVKVNSDFHGIIIAGGTVTVNASITYTVPTSEVLTSAEEDSGIPLSDYINESMFNGEKSTSDNEWSPDKLVYYSNWQKN